MHGDNPKRIIPVEQLSYDPETNELISEKKWNCIASVFRATIKKYRGGVKSENFIINLTPLGEDPIEAGKEKVFGYYWRELEAPEKDYVPPQVAQHENGDIDPSPVMNCYFDIIMSEIESDENPDGKLQWKKRKFLIDHEIGAYEYDYTLWLKDEKKVPCGFKYHFKNTTNKDSGELYFPFYNLEGVRMQIAVHRIPYLKEISKHDPTTFRWSEMTIDHLRHIHKDLNWTNTDFTSRTVNTHGRNGCGGPTLGWRDGRLVVVKPCGHGVHRALGLPGTRSCLQPGSYHLIANGKPVRVFEDLEQDQELFARLRQKWDHPDGIDITEYPLVPPDLSLHNK